jgi:hypothetical protein
MVNLTRALGGLSSGINCHSPHAITTSASLTEELTRYVTSMDHVDCARLTLPGVGF